MTVIEIKGRSVGAGSTDALLGTVGIVVFPGNAELEFGNIVDEAGVGEGEEATPGNQSVMRSILS